MSKAEIKIPPALAKKPAALGNAAATALDAAPKGADVKVVAKIDGDVTVPDGVSDAELMNIGKAITDTLDLSEEDTFEWDAVTRLRARSLAASPSAYKLLHLRPLIT